MSDHPTDHSAEPRGFADPGVVTADRDFLNASDPFALFQAWFQDAELAEVNDPNAMALATVDAAGMPNVRVVLLKGLDEAARGTDRGFVFYTNLESQKGLEILGSQRAALNFHWKSLGRQVRIRGAVARVPEAEADDYFASRPRGSRIGAWASQQSRPLDRRETLEARIADIAARYGDGDIPRPPHWSGLRVTPLEIEFWHDRPFRLHDRLVFRRSASAADWSRQRLYP